MKIIHIDFTGAYNEKMSYQGNLLPIQNVIDGHDVTLITTCYKWEESDVVYTGPEDTVLGNGIRLIRLPYKQYLNEYISQKLRNVDRIYAILEKINPDIIMIHGIQTFAIKEILKYKRMNSHIRLLADSHSDYNNSAKNIISKYLLHKLIYKKLAKQLYQHLDVLYYISLECKHFLIDVYNLPDGKMEYLPLGGVVFDENERVKKREMIRGELGLIEQDILIVHTGKMNKRKRTLEILEAFMRSPNHKLHLVIIGSIGDDIKEEFDKVILLNERIQYLGWMDMDELFSYLCACDLYVQPGGQSATMQNAACCGAALALYPYPSHRHLFEDAVFYIKSQDDMVSLFQEIVSNRELLENKKIESFEVAKQKLDYRILASYLYE